MATEKKRMLEATAGYKTVFWLDMIASDTKQKKHTRMGTMKLDFLNFYGSGISDDCKKSESEFLDDSARETTICTCADDAKESAHA